MRQELIKFVKVNIPDEERYIAWLEKQGEQKREANYPKFDLNDILALQCCMETVKKVQEDKELYGRLQSLHGRLYDAYQLEKQGEQELAECNNSILRNKLLELFQRFRWYCKDETPTNGDILEYVDAHTQELISITHKLAWSEEDITHYNRIIEELSIQKEKPINASYVELINSDIDWLKSLKERVGCEMNCTTTKEWSEEDENRFNNLCWLIDKSDENEPTKNGFKNWLKKRILPQQPKQEWSKEDKYNHDIILYLLNNECVGVADKRIAIEWFKSLKERYTWKPSDEQMNALHDAAVYVDKSMFPYPKGILMKLYKQLKKLRKE